MMRYLLLSVLVVCAIGGLLFSTDAFASHYGGYLLFDWISQDLEPEEVTHCISGVCTWISDEKSSVKIVSGDGKDLLVYNVKVMPYKWWYYDEVTPEMYVNKRIKNLQLEEAIELAFEWIREIDPTYRKGKEKKELESKAKECEKNLDYDEAIKIWKKIGKSKILQCESNYKNFGFGDFPKNRLFRHFRFLF